MSRPRRRPSPASRRRSKRRSSSHRCGQGHDPGRSGQRNFRGAGEQALRRPRLDRLRVGAERAAGDLPHRGGARQRSARHRRARLGGQAGRVLQRRNWRRRRRRSRMTRRVRSASRAQPRLYRHRRPGRRRRRQPHAARRPICSGRHAADVGRAERSSLCRRQLQGNPAHRRPSGAAGRDRSRHVPGPRLHGHVDSLAPASGQEFALLPPDNATGNFTKVVQRIPVKIVLDAGQPARWRLRPGMSVYPTIDTKPQTLRTAAADIVARSHRPFTSGGTHHVQHGARGCTPFSAHRRACQRGGQSQPDGLDRRSRQHDRRLHGDPQHPDHQRLAARYRGRHRNRRRQRRLDFDLLPDRRDRRHPADRLPEPGFLVPALSSSSTRSCSRCSRSAAPSPTISAR